MTAKIKPVEPTVIKNKKIVQKVIAQVRRKPAAGDIKWAKARRKLFPILKTFRSAVKPFDLNTLPVPV